ncbi:MAG: MFS transporter [Flavobacteriales bacterium]|nr:MFS transporter [Flavobacteriales bacterium]
MKNPKHVLPVIVLSQLFCTSLWFAGNAIIQDLTLQYGLESGALGYLTSSVQLGFILGTFVFALLSIADRFSPSKVFFICALLGAGMNLAIVSDYNSYESILSLRFLTGFFLAGIYPVGMKIAADYFDKGLGTSLGYLVGALVIGTALPHLLSDLKGELPWQSVLIFTSGIASLGGIMMVVLVPDGPYRKLSKKLELNAISKVFKVKEFRKAAFGYFGHMWELYAFWAMVPVILIMYSDLHPETSMNTSLLSFLIIAIGGVACVIGANLAEKRGARKIALGSLFLSGLCCLMAPIFLYFMPIWVLVPFLLFWGMVVISDSPLFSTLVAKNAPPELKGTALTVVNSIGFAITIVSIQLVTGLKESIGEPWVLVVLGIGPLFGLGFARSNKEKAIN